MRVWITGAAGFVGRRLAARLREDGAEVVPSDLGDVDVSDAPAVQRTLARLRPDAVVHLAALSSSVRAEAEPLRAMRVNLLGSLAVLEGMRRETPGAKLLLVSSGAVYGSLAPGAAPFREDAPLRPQGVYAAGKAAADLLGAHYARHGQCVLRVRPFNHTGPGRGADFAEARFARALAEMEQGRRPPVLRVGNLDARRDFLHVDDVVEAYCRLLRDHTAGGVFNVAGGRALRIGELLEMLVANARVRPSIEVDPALLRPADASAGDARRLQEQTGWAPRHRLEDALAQLLDEARTHAVQRKKR